MDLITLNANYQADKLIENYDSLIWTERFNTMGDFQLTTGNIDQFLTLLPEGTALSLRETNEVMLVETHTIERKKNTPSKLTITGRTFSSILDRRAALQALTGGDWQVVVKTAADVAYFIIVKVCVDGVVDVADKFPAAQVQFPSPADYLASTGPTRQFSVSKGNLLSTVLTLLQTESKADATTTPATPAQVQHGIRSVRPNAAGTAVGIQIYTGTDKTNAIRFEAARDVLDDGTYLFSKINSATAAYILGPSLSAQLNKAAAIPTGLARRVILVDATSSGIIDAANLRAQGELSLADARETALFDGSINADLSPYKYGVDYGLGDIVKLVGDYGLSSSARVTEYIRSEDSKGNKAYPTLVTI